MASMSSGSHGTRDAQATQLPLDAGTLDQAADTRARAADGRETLTGTLGRVVFQSPHSDWKIARMSVEAKDDDVTVVGNLGDVYEGMPIKLYGSWETHQKYGVQFRVESFQPIVPETLVGLERYLGSRQFAGVGPELAKRVVAHFGHELIAVLSHAPHRLNEVEGIGPARAQAIAHAWNQHQDRREVKIFLHSYGVTDAYAERIFKRYGRDAVKLIRENPYRLALDIWGIGFKTADAIARSLGLETTAPERLEAGIIHVLGRLGEDGHVHVPQPNLEEGAAEILAVDIGLIPPSLDALEQSQLIVRETLGDRGVCVSLTALWQCEHNAAAAFSHIASTPMRPMTADVSALIRAFEQLSQIEFAPAQRRAIEAAIMDKCVVITGGPGVGKTTIVRTIVNIMLNQERKIALAAPTGRAAKRLSESTGMEALTVHRLLEYQPHLGYFQRDADRPLDVDAVIVDEVSMVDIHLFESLVVAIPPSAQLILVGDVDQLPSVGPGSVLEDIIASGQATVVRLTEIFRQAARSRIITAAHEVNRGVLPTLESPPGRDASRSDFYFIHRDDPSVARQVLVDLVAQRIPDSFGFSAIRDIQVLTPMHRGELGTRKLNEVLQERLNPPRKGAIEVIRGERAFRVGDKVMQIKNDYDKSVFNGDIGVIQDIAGEEHKLVVDFASGRVVTYKKDELDKLIHSYAISVHKSQGSEYPAVVMPITTHHYMMLQRNLLYTAMTRGKQLVVLIGMPRAIQLAVENHSPARRWTWLAERIRSHMPA